MEITTATERDERMISLIILFMPARRLIWTINDPDEFLSFALED
jgi:hypothetical protein